MSAMSEDSFDANLEESAASRGRDPHVTFVASSWTIRLALSQIHDASLGSSSSSSSSTYLMLRRRARRRYKTLYLPM